MSSYLASTLAIAALMSLLWVASVLFRDASIVDPFWGLGFAVVAWVCALAEDWAGWRVVLVALVTVWGLRLSLYLGWRNLGKGEDFRYRAMREKWGARFSWVSLVTVFGLQGVLMWIVSLPLQSVGGERTAVLGAAGIAVWTVGLVFEAVGDLQLARFRRDASNRGRVLDTGLWRYTRHPNYFGDAVVWWGLWLVALAAGAPWWTAVGPALMTFLLRRVSGVTLLERSLKERRPGYEEYVRRTSPFLPLPPRTARQ